MKTKKTIYKNLKSSMKCKKEYLLRTCLSLSFLAGLASPLEAAGITVEFKNLKTTEDGIYKKVCYFISRAADSFEDFTLDGLPLMMKYDSVMNVACFRSKEEAFTLEIENLEEGEYAIRAYQDINNNGVLDSNAIGIPKEPVAISGKRNLGPPKFSKAKVAIFNDKENTFLLKF